METPEAGQARADFQFAAARCALKEIGESSPPPKAVSGANRARSRSGTRGETEHACWPRTQAASQLLDLNVHAADYRELSLEVVAERMQLLGIPSNIPDLDSKMVTANLTRSVRRSPVWFSPPTL